MIEMEKITTRQILIGVIILIILSILGINIAEIDTAIASIVAPIIFFGILGYLILSNLPNKKK